MLQFLMDEAPRQELQNSINFVSDSLFCEYAHLIDFDKNTLEVFLRFNEKPLDESERFFACNDQKREVVPPCDPPEFYYPVKFGARWRLSNLPSGAEFVEKISNLKEAVLEKQSS